MWQWEGVILCVAPAKAGTHNHGSRESIDRGYGYRLARLRRLAGTTRKLPRQLFPALGRRGDRLFEQFLEAGLAH
jgi:hypothetical protein